MSEQNGTAPAGRSIRDLAALLVQAGPADAAELDREIAQVEAVLTRLRQLRKILGTGRTSPPPPVPRVDGTTSAVPRSRAGQPDPRTANTWERRWKLALHMKFNGHMTPSEIAKLLGAPASTVHRVLDFHWFAREGHGKYSLTAEGRQALEQRETAPAQPEEEDE